MKHLARALVSVALGAPVVFIATGAAPSVLVPVLAWCAGHVDLLLVAGLVGVVLVLVGLIGLGLCRGLSKPCPPAPDLLDVELAGLLDAEATNPRGVRIPHCRSPREAQP